MIQQLTADRKFVALSLYVRKRFHIARDLILKEEFKTRFTDAPLHDVINQDVTLDSCFVLVAQETCLFPLSSVDKTFQRSSGYSSNTDEEVSQHHHLKSIGLKLYQHSQTDGVQHVAWPQHADVPRLRVDLKQAGLISCNTNRRSFLFPQVQT